MISAASNGRLPRRTFLRRSAAAASLWTIAPAAALGRAGAAPPSDRITLGCIGIGAMGRGHLQRFLRRPEVQVLAVCDVDRWRREQALSTVEAAYAEQAGGGYRGCSAHNDLRELLDRGEIDAVVIAMGDRWHAAASILAAKAGKDIYCEKPVSLTITEAQAIVPVVRRYGRVFQTGMQQRSAHEFRLACDLIRQGALGRVRRIYVTLPGVSQDVDLPAEPVPEGLDWDLWLGPVPWRAFHSRYHHYGAPRVVVPWDFCRDFGGGSLTSGAVHAFDVVQWALEQDDAGPLEIVPPELDASAALTFKYPGGVLVHVVRQRLDPRRHEVPPGWDEITSIQHFGGLFLGERGWLHVGRNGYLTAHPAEIVDAFVDRYDHGVAIDAHHQNWLNCMRTRRTTACDASVGCRSTIVAHLGCLAHWTGRALRWDAVQGEFLGDEEANRMRRRAMRAPWRV